MLEVGNLLAAKGNHAAAREYWRSLVATWGGAGTGEEFYQVTEARRLLAAPDSEE
jgi:hypothetical protein